MTDSVPWQVYENLIKMFGYRNCNFIGKKLDATTFSEKLNYAGYIILEGRRDAPVPDAPVSVTFVDKREKNISVILIAPDSSYATKTPEFKKLLPKIQVKKGETNNVVFVTANGLTNPIIKSLPSFVEASGAYVEHYDYDMFKIEKPCHSSIPPHVILGEDEAIEFENAFRIVRKDNLKIARTDVMAVWLGLRQGMIVKIYRASETAGEMIAYRLCE